MQQGSWEEQETLNLPEFLMEEPQLPQPDDELLGFDALDPSESLLGSAETSQGGADRDESGDLSEHGVRPATGGRGAGAIGTTGPVALPEFC